MAGESPGPPLFTASRNIEMPEKRLLPFPTLQSLQPPMQQSQTCRGTGTTLPAHRLCKGEYNLHHSTWQQGPQVIQALSNGALALLGTGLAVAEDMGKQRAAPLKPLVTSACWEQGPSAC